MADVIEVTGSSKAHHFAIMLAFAALTFTAYEMWAWRKQQAA